MDMRHTEVIVKIPSALRITQARWSVPARSPSQRVIRDAQSAASTASKGQCDIADVQYNEVINGHADAKRAGRLSKVAAHTVQDLKRFLPLACPREFELRRRSL